MSVTGSPPKLLRVFAFSVSLGLVGATAAGDPPELEKLRNSFNRHVRSVLEPLVLKYKVELEKIEKKLAATGKLDEALKVREVREVDLMGPFTEVSEKEPMADLGRQKSELRKALEFSVWTLHDQARFKDRPTYLMLQPGGSVLLWDGRLGTWAVTGSREVEIGSSSWGGNKIKMTLAEDVTSYDGVFTSDKSRRWGKLVAAGVE